MSNGDRMRATMIAKGDRRVDRRVSGVHLRRTAGVRPGELRGAQGHDVGVTRKSDAERGETGRSSHSCHPPPTVLGRPG